MIKFAFFVCVLYVLTTKAECAPDQEALLKFIQAAVNDCYEDEERSIKVEVNPAGFEALITNDPNPPRNTKCMRYCVMEAHNLYDDNGNLNPDEIKKLFTAVYPKTMDESKLNLVATMAETCTSDLPDRCDKAHALTMCMIDGLKEKGFDIKV